MSVFEYYTAPWCVPCQKLKPVWNSIPPRPGVVMRVVDIDVEAAPPELKSVPWLRQIVDGEVVRSEPIPSAAWLKARLG